MGNGLKYLRERAEMTHEAAAAAMGMSRSGFIKLEYGERKLSDAHIAKAMEVFGASEREVLNGPEVKRMAQVVGLVSAGSDMVSFADGQGPFGEVEAPANATPSTVAVEVRGDSLGSFFDGAVIFYDDRRDPVTADQIGAFCVVGLADGRVVAKKIMAGQLPGRYNLIANVGPPIYDAKVVWAAKVIDIRPR